MTAISRSGFRPFFLCAGLFSILSMLLWMLIYLNQFQLPLDRIPGYQWHAHEMIYGYSLAVIAGFLLTAVQNWTGVQTIQGKPLLILAGLWLAARLALLSGNILAAALFDLLFILSLSAAVIHPVIQVKQWKQIAVIAKLLSLFVCNLLFYLGALGSIENGLYWGIYGGLYLVVGLILMMGRRVVPFFIERGVDQPVQLFNSQWLDGISLVSFLAFFVSIMVIPDQAFPAYMALVLFVVNAIRLLGWHTPGIWKKPLLWSLYLALWFVCLGFLLLAGHYFFGITEFAAIHAFAYGGIGSITLSMMSRVALGHSGRDISKLPAWMMFAFGIMVLGTLTRVACPLLFPDYYVGWIILSQIFWMIAFLIFTWQFTPILIKPRVDGNPG